MDHRSGAPYTVRMSIGMRLFTWLNGRVIGNDGDGNIYYEMKRRHVGDLRLRRWVMYGGGPVEATRIPPEWHAWLHYTTDAPLPDTGRRGWWKPHLANGTGSPAGYRPPGHDYSGGQRSPIASDYEPWTPES